MDAAPRLLCEDTKTLRKEERSFSETAPMVFMDDDASRELVRRQDSGESCLSLSERNMPVSPVPRRLFCDDGDEDDEQSSSSSVAVLRLLRVAIALAQLPPLP